MAKRDEEEQFISDLLPGLAELGLLGMVTPETYGGSGLDEVSYAVAIEELARVCPSTAVIVSVTNSVCQEPILRFGNEAQKRRFLPPRQRGTPRRLLPHGAGRRHRCGIPSNQSGQERRPVGF